MKKRQIRWNNNDENEYSISKLGFEVSLHNAIAQESVGT